MKQIPDEIKITYLIIFIVMIFFVVFIIFVVFMYNRKQILYIKEKQLKDAEYQNLILQKELEKQKSLENERLRISYDMHDEIGAGISAIKLQSEILKQQSQNINHQEIDELISISDNMNISLREMLWSLNTKNDYFQNFAEYCQNYTENYFSKTKIALKFSTSSENADRLILSDVRRNLLLVIKEACHNIIKHTQAEEVTICINQNNEKLSILIKDNGKGFPQNESKGYGLTTMQSRIETLGGTFTLTSDDFGTSILILI